jgi:RNA polymerase sigma factor (sigma-70 family)
MSDEADQELQLLERWRAGDARAGTVLFERYFPGLYRFFRNKVREGAEDLVQETFLACVRNAERFRGESSFRSYVFRAAHSKLFDHYRRRHKRDAIDYGVTSAMDLGESPSKMLVREEDEGLLLAALRRLPLELQIVLELYYVEKLSGPVLSEVLAVPEGTVRSRLRRAREQLREQVQAVATVPDAAVHSLADLDAWAERLRRGGLAPPTA